MTRRRLLAAATAFALLSGAAQALNASANPAPPRGAPAKPAASPYKVHDYSKIKGLSKPQFVTETESFMVPMEDGAEMYVEVTKPTKPGKYGVILELSPYHGTIADRAGTRIFPGPVDADDNKIGLTGYFAPRGYAVVMADLRGTGRSGGCLDHMGPKDQSDAKTIVEWAASQPWSNGRVGMTGHSYVGSTPQMAAAQNPKGLVTIVPSAGLAAMYHHEFQGGVPYSLQYIGPLEAYEELAINRHLPPQLGPEYGDDFGNHQADFGCGLPQSSAVTGEALASGAEVAWHKERDFRKGVTASKVPVFAIHGVNDNAARIAALDWFHARGGRKGDKAWIGQWDHGSGCCPNRREDQWTFALHAWFDKHLLKRNVVTGPPVEVFLNDGRVFTPTAWPPKPSRNLTYSLTGEGELITGAELDEAGSEMFVADPRGYSSEFGTGLVDWESEPLAKGMLITGIPTMKLVTSVIGERIHINATLYDVSDDGVDRISQAGWAIQPELRHGADKPTPVIPNEKMTIDLTSQAVAHYLAPGHSLRLVVAASMPDKVPTFAAGAAITVFSGEGGTTFSLPVHDGAKLWPDVIEPA